MPASYHQGVQAKAHSARARGAGAMALSEIKTAERNARIVDPLEENKRFTNEGSDVAGLMAQEEEGDGRTVGHYDLPNKLTAPLDVGRAYTTYPSSLVFPRSPRAALKSDEMPHGLDDDGAGIGARVLR